MTEPVPAQYKQVLISGFLLWLFAVIGVGLVAGTFVATGERITDNERQALLKALHQLLPPERFDNDIAEDRIQLPHAYKLGSDGPVTAWRARKNGQPVAIIFKTVAPDGYNGAIHLLVGIYVDGRLAGVRVVKHNETPGLGDGIETRKSDWIRQFDGKSLGQPHAEQWKVKRDGGAFDQMTGATITPRAIVKAVKNALEYYDEHKQELFQ